MILIHFGPSALLIASFIIDSMASISFALMIIPRLLGILIIGVGLTGRFANAIVPVAVEGSIGFVSRLLIVPPLY